MRLKQGEKLPTGIWQAMLFLVLTISTSQGSGLSSRGADANEVKTHKFNDKEEQRDTEDHFLQILRGQSDEDKDDSSTVTGNDNLPCADSFLLGAPFNSSGAPPDKEILARIRDLFILMAIICDYKPGLSGLVYKTKRDFAKKYFGNPLEARPVTIKGVEPLENYDKLPLDILASKAYKQLAIFHLVFQDISSQWSQNQEENEQVKQKLKCIETSLDSLKRKMGLVVRFIRHSSGSSSLPKVPQPNKKVWTKSADQQKVWILGVLGKFTINLLYLEPAIRMRAKHMQ